MAQLKSESCCSFLAPLRTHRCLCAIVHSGLIADIRRSAAERLGRTAIGVQRDFKLALELTVTTATWGGAQRAKKAAVRFGNRVDLG